VSYALERLLARLGIESRRPVAIVVDRRSRDSAISPRDLIDRLLEFAEAKPSCGRNIEHELMTLARIIRFNVVKGWEESGPDRTFRNSPEWSRTLCLGPRNFANTVIRRAK